MAKKTVKKPIKKSSPTKVKASAKPVKTAAKAAKKAKTFAKPAKKAAVRKSVAKSTGKATPKKAAGGKATKKIVKVSVPQKARAKTSPAKKIIKSQTPKMRTAPKLSAGVAKKAVSADWSQFITPLDDRLIVEKSESAKKTAGGLYIPDTVEISGNFEGKVLVVGRGHRNKKGKLRLMDVKAGDVVLFSEHAGDKINLLGTEVRILRESDILGVLG